MGLKHKKIQNYARLITSFGLSRNEYCGAFIKTLTLDDLYKWNSFIFACN